tara:strand:- start:327 stop:941 length:615 start_codon:yes stop_codon:yes gene_type:complete
MEQTLHNALHLIEEIYDNAMYEGADMFRIKDIIHSLSKNQTESKKWLAYELCKLYGYDSGNILIIGGWYGLMANYLRKKFPEPGMNITSIDMDPECQNIAWKLFPDIDSQFITAKAEDIDISLYNVIVSTSVEHIEKQYWIDLVRNKNPDAWVCLQSNNYFDHPTHINCSYHTEHMIRYLNLDWVAYSGAINNHNFQRFMVIGK